MITFGIVKKAHAIHGRLTYVKAEYSFRFEKDATAAYDFLNQAGTGSAPLIIEQYLQLEVSVQTGFLLCVDGPHSHHRWKRDSLPQIHPTAGIVKASFGREMNPGIGVQLVPPGTWTR